MAHGTTPELATSAQPTADEPGALPMHRGDESIAIRCSPLLQQAAPSVVALKTVTSFQRNLQNALKLYERQTPGDDWGALYSAGWKRLTRLQLDTFFA